MGIFVMVDEVKNVSHDNEVSHVSAAEPGETKMRAGASAGGVSSPKTMSELKETAPEVYKAVLRTVATEMCSKMRKGQERLKKIIREGRNQ